MSTKETIAREAEEAFAALTTMGNYRGKESTRSVLRAIIATCKLAHADYPAAISSIRKLAEIQLRNVS